MNCFCSVDEILIYFTKYIRVVLFVGRYENTCVVVKVNIIKLYAAV